jgi:hypothetical protein
MRVYSLKKKGGKEAPALMHNKELQQLLDVFPVDLI